MIDSWGKKDFKTLYNEFKTNPSGGKIFMMRKNESEDTLLDKGVTILLKKASLFILNILKELYLKDSTHIIGDINLLLSLVDQRRKIAFQKLKNQKATMLAKASKRRIQLHTILRRQRSLKPIKSILEKNKEKEQ
ncbi:hypothetical protein [Tenacibaculum halocynthiae]|uniref:hypothetical protein n=1 Tax=Tenacibaculum halocynthiae TaxID=1254437 RepID=UPI003D64F44E